MVQRPHTSRFMPGAWVFPGGAVDADDADPPGHLDVADEWRTAALRELAEEVGLWVTAEGVVERAAINGVFADASEWGLRLDASALTYFSNWITPDVFPLRFDTRFYLAVADASVRGAVDGDELIDLAWVNPVVALRREREGLWDIAFPTRKTLELLATESTADDLERSLDALEMVPAIQPRLFVGDGTARIVMPDESLYDDIADDQTDPTILSRLADVIARGGHVPAEFKR